MKKASEVNLDSLVTDLIDDEIGMVLVNADGPSILDVLASASTYKDKQGKQYIMHSEDGMRLVAMEVMQSHHLEVKNSTDFLMR